MGRSFESVKIGAKEVSARWLKASRALKKEDQIYGQRLAEMVKKHSSEAFYAFDDPLEAALFSVLVELMRELEKSDVDLFDTYYKGCVELWNREEDSAESAPSYNTDVRRDQRYLWPEKASSPVDMKTSPSSLPI
jgi:hypothetical protein